jgi:hypothetical protein
MRCANDLTVSVGVHTSLDYAAGHGSTWRKGKGPRKPRPFLRQLRTELDLGRLA